MDSKNPLSRNRQIIMPEKNNVVKIEGRNFPFDVYFKRKNNEESIKTLVTFLKKFKLDVYLAGSVVKCLFVKQSKSTYDFDLLCTGEKEKLLLVLENFLKLQNSGKLLKLGKEEFQVLVNIKEVDLGFWDETKVHLKQKKSSAKFLHQHIPLIDITLLSKEAFEKTH
ncbi:MAG: hypothetical protein ACP5OG_02370 [Candidatus Nanoarchaeia archaeon]